MGRILLIAGSASRVPSLAASSIQVMRMAGAFAALGHEVTLLVPHGRGELAGLAVPDVRASARYRQLLVETLVPRALARCVARLGEAAAR